MYNNLSNGRKPFCRQTILLSPVMSLANIKFAESPIVSNTSKYRNTGPNAASLELARVPSTHAEGDYVTAVTDPASGELQLLGYRSGDRP